MLVIAMICIDKHKLLSGFTGKLHFVSSVVKRRYLVKDFTHCLFQFI